MVALIILCVALLAITIYMCFRVPDPAHRFAIQMIQEFLPAADLDATEDATARRAAS